MQPDTRPAHEQCPFRLDQCGGLGLLRRAFEDAGYSDEAALKTVLNDESGEPLSLAAALRRTDEASPRNTMIRLFTLARVVPEEAARAALAPAELEPLVALGLLRRSSDGVRAEAAVMPQGDQLLAWDFLAGYRGTAKPRDSVVAVGASSQTAANLAVRRQIGLALDLGTGCGYLGLLAARHAERVIGTDVNPRALNFAALSARLNEVSNLELRRGSLYEPVADCRFDQIVSNPPFVISPETRYEYRDSGMPGDTFSEQVLRGAPARLSEGGFCTVVLNWHHRGDDDWAERPMRWIASSGCDALLIWAGLQDTVSYAYSWLPVEGRSDPDRHARQLDEWLAYYERLDIRRISFGALVLRRRSASRNWVHVVEVPSKKGFGSSSDQLERIFAAYDLLEGLDDDRDLLDCSLVLTPDHRLEHVLQAERGHWTVRAARLCQVRGLPFVGDVDCLTGAIVAGCDGLHTLRELTDDLGSSLGVDVGQVVEACVPAIRKLLETGFLYEAGQRQAQWPGPITWSSDR